VPFRIFKLQSDGDLHFIEAHQSFDLAKGRVQELAELWPGEYVVEDEAGERVFVTATQISIGAEAGGCFVVCEWGGPLIPSRLEHTLTPNAIAMLTNPTGHLVYTHTDDAHLAEAVGVFASAGLREGEAVILIMSASHGKPIRKRLECEGFDLRALESAGQLVCESAEELIPTFLINGVMDELSFKTTFGAMIERVKSFNGKRRPVRLFGEGVDLLWQSNPRITQRIEELCNELTEAHSVPILCAYSLAGIKPGVFPEELLACHSHAVA
jgi:hypothetical protein